MDSVLIHKYNVPAPRYTGYPTLPFWQEKPPLENQWKRRVVRAFQKDNAISLYIHLPFCEQQCTYCGFHKHITRDHTVEEPYLRSVLREWQLYVDLLPGRPVLREWHLGGGTPTFFSPENLKVLIGGILETVTVPPEAAYSIEAHPHSTTYEHLATLRSLGFNGVSIGIQDFAPEILQVINRRQTLEDVEKVTLWARELGYRSVSYDLIFGLPLQTKEHIYNTMTKVRSLRPERIALYSYGHLLRTGPDQRSYLENDRPSGRHRPVLYELARRLLQEGGYQEIGMGHFALPKDSLYQAMETGTLHRNFMGYTPYYTRLSVGLGASAISDSWDAYVQNEKQVERYEEIVNAGRLPIQRGHLLSEEDQVLRGHILNIMCRYETIWYKPEYQCPALYEGLDRLREMEQDGLLKLYPYQLKVTREGRPFLRHICLALDARYWRKQAQDSSVGQAV